MKKVICLLMIGLLVSFFALETNALAQSNELKITKKKLVNTEWEIKGTAKMYLASTGDYLGSMIGGVGLADFGETDATGIVAPVVVTGLGVITGASGEYTLDAYTLKGNILRSTSGSVLITAPDGTIIEEYDGPLKAKITFKGKKYNKFSGKIEYTNNLGVKNVIKVAGVK